ncbi:hypothetical protein [Alteromonas sp. H39]|uniref:hypothetical protein n=1 Tax=Alteromonas sp. H39 TaxID=3389876 RepID=UPI0039DFB7F0
MPERLSAECVVSQCTLPESAAARALIVSNTQNAEAGCLRETQSGWYQQAKLTRSVYDKIR